MSFPFIGPTTRFFALRSFPERLPAAVHRYIFRFTGAKGEWKGKWVFFAVG